jgi:hypothetical protein
MPFEPFILNSATLSLDSDAFEGQISGAVFTPANNAPVAWKAINGDSHSRTPTADWTLDLSYAQDWDEATALSRYLHEHEGEVVPAVFTPANGDPTVTANVSITPGAIGMGDAAAVAASTVSLGTTRPVLGPVV